MAQEIPDMHFMGEVAQKALIEKDGSVLMCRNVGETFWDFPGGRLHKEEDPKAGLLRELYEELGTKDIEIGSPIQTFVYTPKDRVPRYFVTFRCRLQNLEQKFVLAEDEIAEVRWVRHEDIDMLEMPEQWQQALKSVLV